MAGTAARRRHETALNMLERRGIRLAEMARVVWELQHGYLPQLTLDDCLEAVRAVIAKREVQYAVITGLTLDEMAEEGTLKEPLGTIVREDPRLYGIDAMIALGIVNMYGSIGMSNYGYLASEEGFVRRCLGDGERGVHTFLDDLLAAIVAAACARIAHSYNAERPPRQAGTALQPGGPAPPSADPAPQPGGEGPADAGPADEITT